MSCRSSKRWYQHIVAPDGFTLTASFSPIFAFTASCQLVFFHGNCTGNFQFKLIVAIMITETTVIRTEDSSGKTIGNSNKKKTAETIRQEKQRYYLKTDQNYLVIEHDACSKFLGLRAHRHFKFKLRPPYLLCVFFFRKCGSCWCFLCSPSVYFSPVQKIVGFREAYVSL